MRNSQNIKAAILLFIATTAFISCTNSNKEEQSDTVSKPSPIVLIFKKNPNSEVIDVSGLKYSMYSPIKYYSKTNQIEIWEYPRYSTSDDTIVIANEKESFIHYKYKFRPYNFYASAGDTITISQQNDCLIFQTNGNTDLAHPNNINYALYSVLPDSIKTDYSFYNEKYAPNKNQSNSKVRFRKDISIVLDLFNKKSQLIESYANTTTATSKIVALHRENLKHERNIFYQDLIDNGYNNTPAPVFEYNDSALVFCDYRNMLYTIIEQGVNYISYSNGIYLDSPKAFGNVLSNKELTPNTRAFLLTRYLKMISEDFPESYLTYVAKYREHITDSLLLRHALLVEKKLAEINEHAKDTGLTLISQNDKAIDFKDILKQNLGKVIYVDFWASWCAPCRASMPNAKELRNEYKNQDVVFLYLALNDSQKAWKKASAQFALNSGCESYFIANPNTSVLIKELNVQTIPRYLIFDKKGNLAHPNAPGPEGNPIRDILNRLLMNK